MIRLVSHLSTEYFILHKQTYSARSSQVPRRMGTSVSLPLASNAPQMLPTAHAPAPGPSCLLEKSQDVFCRAFLGRVPNKLQTDCFALIECTSCRKALIKAFCAVLSPEIRYTPWVSEESVCLRGCEPELAVFSSGKGKEVPNRCQSGHGERRLILPSLPRANNFL